MLKECVEAKYRIEALDDQRKLLEEAKKAGMRVAGKMLSVPHGDEALKKAILDGYQSFLKSTPSKAPDPQAAKYFMQGFHEAYDTDNSDN